MNYKKNVDVKYSQYHIYSRINWQSVAKFTADSIIFNYSTVEIFNLNVPNISSNP